jgi:transposase InsO family protein
MVFEFFHNSVFGGHLGVFKTINKTRAHFIWKGTGNAIRARVRACRICAMSKPVQTAKLGFLASEIAQRPLQKIFIDYVGKFPRSKLGNTMVLVCVDAFSKFVWPIPVREATTSTTIKVLKERVFSKFSVSEILVSDNARCFTSHEFQRFCFDLAIKHVTTSPYYHRPSPAERFNRNRKAALIAYHSDNHVTWDQNLTWLQLAFNTAKHESTLATPFEIIFPFRAGSPLLHKRQIQGLIPEEVDEELLVKTWNQVKRYLLSHHRVGDRYNRERLPQPFKAGHHVYLLNHPVSDASRRVSAKLSPRWRGPFEIHAFLTPVTVRLVQLRNKHFVTKAHASQLKLATCVFKS